MRGAEWVGEERNGRGRNEEQVEWGGLGVTLHKVIERALSVTL